MRRLALYPYILLLLFVMLVVLILSLPVPLDHCWLMSYHLILSLANAIFVTTQYYVT